MSFKFVNGRFCVVSAQGLRPPLPLLDLVQRRDEPLYLYDREGIRQRVSRLKECLPSYCEIRFAMKSNHQSEILKIMSSLDCGVDVVSGGELELAVEAGISPERIVFSGVGKSSKELSLAMHRGIEQINVESLGELERISRLRREISELKGTIRVGYRLNPDVDAETHPYVKTGLKENKFGLDAKHLDAFYSIVKASSALSWTGVALHIGSQIQSAEPFVCAARFGLNFFKKVKGLGIKLNCFDLGGGWAVDYQVEDDEKDWRLVNEICFALSSEFQFFHEEGAKILVEPGRFLVARYGVLLAQVEYIKKTEFKDFAILNTGMNHFMRPCLYQARHRIVPLVLDPERKEKVYEFVGPICESSDVLARDVTIQELVPGDWVAICDTGAYGSVLANDYNLRGKAEEIFV